MPIAHVCLSVLDLPAAKAFYTTVLAPLHYSATFDFGAQTCGFGVPGGINDFWIVPTGGEKPQKAHIAFQAESREVVEKFHEAALKAGGTCNGKPGLRPQYAPNYYAAFITDLDGHNMECCCSKPE